MAVKYYSTFVSNYTDTAYRVELLDNTFVGASTEIEIKDFEIRYEKEGDEIYTPIKASQCKVSLMITDNATGTALQSWLTGSVLNGDEDRYTVGIYQSSALIWYGVILPDIAARKDMSPPYEWDITATDGIGRLKDFEFNPAYMGGGLTHAIVSHKDLLYDALKKTPLYSTTETNLFSTSVEWYEDRMPARSGSTDPIDQTYIDTWAFTTIEDGVRIGFSLYKVLEEICKTCRMRMIFSNGIYRFIQIQSYEGGTGTTYERFYRRSDGSYVSNTAFNPSVTWNSGSSLPRVRSGNQWSYFPPLKNVRMRFPIVTNANMLNGGQTIPYTEVLPDNIVGGTDVVLIFATNLRINIIDAAFSTTNGAEIAVQIDLNLDTDYVLQKDALGALNSWQVTGTAQWLRSTKQSYVDFQIAFRTDELPAGIYASNSFTIDVIEVKDSLTGANLNYSATRLNSTTSLTYATSLDGEQAYIPYEVGNVLGVINSYDIEETDAIMGEMFNPTYFGGLYTGDTSSWNPSSALWRYKDTGVAYSMNFLRVRETMAAQIKPVPKYQGAVVGAASVFPHSSIIYDGSVYILNGGAYSANMETWDGEWFKVDYNRASVDDIEGDTAEDDGGGTGDLYRTIGDLSNQSGLFQLRGGSEVINIVSADSTLTPNTQIVHSTAASIQTLPPASNWIINGNSIMITIKNAAGIGDDVTITPDGTETIDGAVDATLTQYQSAVLYSDGSNIFIK
jgi:hypothetical protein